MLTLALLGAFGTAHAVAATLRPEALSLRVWDDSLQRDSAGIAVSSPDFGWSATGAGVDYFYSQSRTHRQRLRTLREALRYGGAIGRVAEALPALDAVKPDARRLIIEWQALIAALQGDEEEARRLIDGLEPTGVARIYTLLARAALSYAEGEFTAAEAVATVAVHEQPDNVFAQNLYAAIAWAKGDIDRAKAAFRKAGRSGAGFLAPWRNLAALAWQHDDPGLAADAYSAMLRQDADLCTALVGRAHARRLLGDSQGAIADAQACLDTGWHRGAAMTLAALHVTTGRAEAADRLLRALEANAPAFAAAMRAEAALRRGDYSAADAALPAAAAMTPGNAYLAALIDAARADWAAARKDIASAAAAPAMVEPVAMLAVSVEAAAGIPHGGAFIDRLTGLADPDPLAAFVAASAQSAREAAGTKSLWQKANGLFGGGVGRDADAAAGSYRPLGLAAMFIALDFAAPAQSLMASSLWPGGDNALALWLQAQLSLRQGEAGKATALLERAADKPGVPWVKQQLGELLISQDDISAAVTVLADLSRETDTPEPLLRAAASAARQGRDEAAARLYDAAAGAFADSLAVHRAAALFHADHSGDLRAALHHVGQGRRLAQDDPLMLGAAGWVDHRLGDHARAARLLRRAVERMRAPGQNLLTRLAIVEQALGNDLVAADYVERALDRGRDFTLYERAKRLSDTLRDPVN